MTKTRHCTATGAVAFYIPEGADRDEVLGLVRVALKFKANHNGKKSGYLSRLVLDCATHAGPPYSFNQLLAELNYRAAQRERHGEQASPVEEVNRSWRLATIHVPKKGRVHVPFGTLRNHLTIAKKKLKCKIPASR